MRDEKELYNIDGWIPTRREHFFLFFLFIGRRKTLMDQLLYQKEVFRRVRKGLYDRFSLNVVVPAAGSLVPDLRNAVFFKEAL